jgi:hypothetical protein
MTDPAAIRPRRTRPAGVDEIETLRAIEVAAGAVFRDVGMDPVADDTPPSTVVLHATVERPGWRSSGARSPRTSSASTAARTT